MPLFESGTMEGDRGLLSGATGNGRDKPRSGTVDAILVHTGCDPCHNAETACVPLCPDL